MDAGIVHSVVLSCQEFYFQILNQNFPQKTTYLQRRSIFVSFLYEKLKINLRAFISLSRINAGLRNEEITQLGKDIVENKGR